MAQVWLLCAALLVMLYFFLNHDKIIPQSLLIFLSPIGVMSAVYWLYYGFAQVYLLYELKNISDITERDIVYGLLLSILGYATLMVGFLFAYKISNNKSAIIPNKYITINDRPNFVFWAIVLMLFAMGNVGYVILYSFHGGLLSSPLRVMKQVGEGNLGFVYFLTLQLNVVMVLSVLFWRSHFIAKIIAIITIIVIVTNHILSGGRSPFVATIITLLVLYGTRNKRLSIAKGILSVAIVAVAFYSISLVRFVFHEKKNYDNVPIEEVVVPDIVISGLIYNTTIKEVPYRVDYQYGSTYMAALVGIVPSFLWENKAEYYLVADKIVADKIFNVRVKTLLPPTLLGELYLNFGLIGCILGPVLFGILAFIIHDKYVKRKTDPFLMAIVSISTPELAMLVRGPFSNHIIPIILVTMTCIFIRWSLRKKA